MISMFELSIVDSLENLYQTAGSELQKCTWLLPSPVSLAGNCIGFIFIVKCTQHRVVIPAGIWCENDVGSTSMRRHHVASTLIRRHFGTKCPLE